MSEVVADVGGQRWGSSWSLWRLLSDNLMPCHARFRLIFRCPRILWVAAELVTVGGIEKRVL
jgi:hypothetical protein